MIYRSIKENFDELENYLLKKYKWEFFDRKMENSVKKFILESCKKYVFFYIKDDIIAWNWNASESFIDYDRILKIKLLNNEI